jgi:GNAT superfamily N-acetyltransferase/ABC-type thiamine transport system ATPase subunit
MQNTDALTFDITKSSTPSDTFRVAQVKGMFDLQVEHIQERFTGTLDMPAEWNIGVIYGASGTGKSTIANQLFQEELIKGFEYTSASVIDDMPKGDIKKVTSMFNAVGFSSPPSWLKPYHVLSNGEKMRVDLARALLAQTDLVVFDEFTSVVDRNVAKIGSYAVQKAVRRLGRKFIAVSCHDDILEWIEPDWTFNTDTMTFDSKKKYTRPDINLEIYQRKGDWNTFRRYHYLNTSINAAAIQYVACIDGRPVGFLAILHFPHPRVANMKKISRVVVLPDYQGVGIGGRLVDFVAKLYADKKFRVTITTSTPALIHTFKKASRWRLIRAGKATGSKTYIMSKTASWGRMTTSWEYR